MALLFIILATVAVSLISLVGVLLLPLGERQSKPLLFALVSFATGTLLGAAFLDMLPEAIAGGAKPGVALQISLASLMVFFIIEKAVSWHHHHAPHPGEHKPHGSPLPYFSLVGAGIHNFFDGVAIAASFMAGTDLGIATTVAIAMHEIPHEFGDFSLLIHWGFSRAKALAYNFAFGLVAVSGGLAFYFFAPFLKGAEAYCLAASAGMFIYIAAVDLVPELHQETDRAKSAMQIGLVLAGIGMMWLVETLLAA